MEVHKLVLPDEDGMGIVDGAQALTTSSTSIGDTDLQYLFNAIERLEAMAKANAERINDAIAALEMDLPSTEPPTTHPIVDIQNEMPALHQSMNAGSNETFY